jgi:hypothetical protein
MSDPNFYREYECNINCPKIKASKIFRCPDCRLGAVTADSLTADSISFSGGIAMYTGSSPFGTTHTITPTQLPVLGNRQCNGEITFYLNNDLYVSVTMGAIVKSKNTILQTLLYQKIGNFTSVTLSFSGNNVILTINPGGTCKWVYRGI